MLLRKTLGVTALSTLAPVLFAGTAFAAGPVAVAPAFKISGCDSCKQNNPHLAGTPSGKLIAAYDIELVPPAPVVQGRIFPVTGAAAKAFRPQPTLTPAQYDAAIASNSAGKFVIAWSAVDAGHNSEVLVQRYGADGKAVGTPLAVNADPAGVLALDTAPSVAIGSDGAFTVTWVRVIPQGQVNPTGPQIWARRYSATGVAATPPTKIADNLIADFRPSVCVDSTGKSVITFATIDEIRPFEPSKIGVSMRRLTAKGVPIGGVTVVAAPLASESHPVVSCGLAGTSVIAWETNQAPAGFLGNVVAQRFGPTGVRVGTPFVASGPSTERQRTPAIAHDADGNFVIVWLNLSPSSTGIYGARFSAAAAKLGDSFTVVQNPTAFIGQTAPAIAASGPLDAFTVAWKDLPNTLLARRFKIVK